MTCNPAWREITEALEPGQSYNDRPDLMARVFKLKLQHFLRDLKEGTFFKDKNQKRKVVFSLSGFPFSA